MKLKQLRDYDCYTEDFLRLVFAEDQASMYAEGLVVLGCHPYLKHQLTLLHTETVVNLLSVIDMFAVADPDMDHPAHRLEYEVAFEMKFKIDAGNLASKSDKEIVATALRLCGFVIGYYKRLIEHCELLGLTSNRDSLEQIYGRKLARADAIAGCLVGFVPTELKRRRGRAARRRERQWLPEHVAFR